LPEEWLIERNQQVGANSLNLLSPSFVVVCRTFAVVFRNSRYSFVTAESHVRLESLCRLPSALNCFLAVVRFSAKLVPAKSSQYSDVGGMHFARSAAEQERRTIFVCIALAKAHEEETGKAPVLDPDFAEDVEEILNHRKPWSPPAWESSSTQASLSPPNAETMPFGKS
jgi:hypothetical protein